MRNKAGPPVRREDFLKRRADTEDLWDLAMSGHILMLGPRRMGKTSLLHHLEDAPEDGWRCVFLSVEALETEARFVARLLTKLAELHPNHAWMERLGGKLRKFFRSLGRTPVGPVEVNLAELLEHNWRDEGAAALKVMGGLRGNTLVLVDEFPIFIRNLIGTEADAEGRRRARLFLDWLREIRNTQPNGDSRVHFVLTGSVGLDAVLSKVGLSGTVNDLQIFHLGPLTPDLAMDLLDQLSEGEQFPLPPAVRNRILERIDWPIPYHLQLLFRAIQHRVQRQGKVLDEALVDQAYESLLAAENQMLFSHWLERLDDLLLKPQERDLQRALLRGAAKDRRGLSQNSILQINTKVAPDLNALVVLTSLARDGYLTQQDNRWRFNSSLLRDWWRKWQMGKMV